MKKKFCRGILSLAFTAMLFLQVPAQLKALKIGDTIPEEVWKTPLQVVNSPEKTTTLANDRDKLILLDFWNTWCSACLKGFPRMEKLQQQYGDRLKILAVSSQDRAELEKFFASKNGQRYKGMSSVSGDLHFKKLFPYVAVPFIVWIKDGKLLNTTDGAQVNEASIAEVLKGEAAALQTVLQVDRSRPLMLAEQFDLEKGTALMNYVLLSKGRLRAIAPGSGFHRQGAAIYGRQFTNMPLLRIYEGIAYEIFETQGQHFSAKRLMNLLKAPSAITVKDTDSPDAVGEKLYSFEFIVPAAKAGTLYPQMLTALNAYSGYTGAVEMRRQKCLVISNLPPSENRSISTPKKGSAVPGQPLGDLIADLNELPNSLLPILDDSGFKGTVAADAKTAGTPEALKRVLREAGLGITEAERELLMLVLKDSTGESL